MKVKYWDGDILKEREATAEEMAANIIWHEDRPLRVQVPMQVIRENKEKIEFGAVDNEYLSGLLTYMLQSPTIKRVIEDDILYAYFDTVFEEHEALLNSINIIVESKP